MRRVVVIAALLGIGMPARAWGGIYNFAEPAPQLSSPEEFRDSLARVKQIYSQELPTAAKLRYGLLGDLVGGNQARMRGLPPTASDLDRLNLSGYLLNMRTGDPRRDAQFYQQAVDELEPVLRRDRDPKNFLAWANRAMAYHKLGQAARAEAALSEALANWPASWDKLPAPRKDLLGKLGWNATRFQDYRDAERYLLKLWRLRQREGPNSPAKELDALFDTKDAKVRFVAADGKYHAGKLAPAEKAKLPDNALAVVELLVLWDPFDMRLYWLAGELLNAEGNPRAARTVFEELLKTGFTTGFSPPELREHYRILQAEILPERPVVPAVPDAGTGKDKETKVEPTGPWPTNPWQMLGVGFGAGAVVALLGVWQVREIRRRGSRP